MATAIKSILNLFQTPVTAAAVLGLLVLATVGVKARVWRNSGPAAASQQQLIPGGSGPVQMVRFTLYDAGIFPREARAGAGLVAIYMEDLSGNSRVEQRRQWKRHDAYVFG